MEKNIEMLINEFMRISKKGWIKSISKSFGSVGLTFEKELGKSPDAMYFPDYYGIEIKCTSKYSEYPLYLFTAAFDGPTFPEINSIVEKYGWYDKDYPDKKVLYAKLGFKQSKYTKNNFKFKLCFNDTRDKIYLCVYDINNKLLEKESFVYVDTIYNHFILKLNILALVYSTSKTENQEKYFRYYKMIIYKVKNFDTFLKLLENDIIKVDLISRMNKSGIDAGRYRNKNLVFYIYKEKMDRLLNEICSYNNDY